MSSCRHEEGNTTRPDWCVTHERSIWVCAATFYKRSRLLENKVKILEKLKEVDNEMRILGMEMEN